MSYDFEYEKGCKGFDGYEAQDGKAYEGYDKVADLKDGYEYQKFDPCKPKPCPPKPEKLECWCFKKKEKEYDRHDKCDRCEKDRKDCCQNRCCCFNPCRFFR
jgi:hypothetical protein